MAVQNRSLGVTNTDISAVPSIESTHNKVVKFKTGSLTLPVGTALAFNEDSELWEPWNPTAAATAGDGFLGVIRAFVYPEPIVLNASGEVLGVVMFGGRIGYADIVKDVTYNPGYTAAILKAAIQGKWASVHAEVAAYAATGNANTLRANGIIVEDVPLIAR